MFQFLISCPKVNIYYNLKCLVYFYAISQKNAEHFIVLPIFFFFLEICIQVYQVWKSKYCNAFTADKNIAISGFLLSEMS